MSMERDLVERAMRAWAPIDPSFESLLLRGERKRRRQQVISAAVAVAIAVVAVAAAVRAFDRSDVPAGEIRPAFRIGDEVLATNTGSNQFQAGTRLEAVDPQTGRRRVLVDCSGACAGGVSYAAWSPDGTRLAYIINCLVRSKEDASPCRHPESASSGVWVKGAMGAARRVLPFSKTSSAWSMTFAWSPDSTSLAIGLWDGVHAGVYLATGALSDPRIVPGSEGLHPEVLSWSPDGTRILVGSDPGVSVVSVRDGSSNQLSESGFDPQWSPDGSRVAFTAPDVAHRVPFGLYVAAADGSNTTLVADAGPFAWSPDGAQLAYEAWAHVGRGGHVAKGIFIVRDDGSRSTVLRYQDRKTAMEGPTLVWSPDASRLTFLERTPSRWLTVWVDGGQAHLPIDELPTISEFRGLSWQPCLCTNVSVYVRS